MKHQLDVFITNNKKKRNIFLKILSNTNKYFCIYNFQKRRFDCSRALEEEFLNYGKKFFHQNISQFSPLNSDHKEFEPLPDFHFVDNYEKHLHNVKIIKGLLYHHISKVLKFNCRFYTYYNQEEIHYIQYFNPSVKLI